MSEDRPPYKRIEKSPEPSEEERWRRACRAAYMRAFDNSRRLDVVEKDLRQLREFIDRILTVSMN